MIVEKCDSQFHDKIIVDAGDLHWKLVSVNLNSDWQVREKLSLIKTLFNGMSSITNISTASYVIYYSKLTKLVLEMVQVVAKMKSKHMAGTFTKNKKCKEINPTKLQS